MKHGKGLSLLIITVIFVAGCTNQSEIIQLVKTLPEVSEFLEQHPNADIRAVLWKENTVSKRIDEIRKECGDQVDVGRYWKVVISENNFDVTVWVDDEIKEPFCIIEHETENTTTTTVQPTTTRRGTTTGEGGDINPELNLWEYCYFLVQVEIPENGISYDDNTKQITLKVKNIGDVDLSGFRTKISGYVGYDVQQVVVNNELIDDLYQWPPPDATDWDKCVQNNSRFSTDEIYLFDNQAIRIGETYEAKIQADLPEFFSVSANVEPRIKYGDIITSCESKSVYSSRAEMPRIDSEECQEGKRSRVESS